MPHGGVAAFYGDASKAFTGRGAVAALRRLNAFDLAVKLRSISTNVSLKSLTMWRLSSLSLSGVMSAGRASTCSID